jgi:hypothetical protein
MELHALMFFVFQEISSSNIFFIIIKKVYDIIIKVHQIKYRMQS